MSELDKLKREIERYARERDWESHANAVERLIKYVREHS